jgi:hypothetical protein
MLPLKEILMKTARRSLGLLVNLGGLAILLTHLHGAVR